ncbi:Nif3-like dinuclear metal center hexameric protein [Spiroplasma sp. TIUS-1]|uniref:Nif3-like dinuclear metal center hexameric protein n=1 Tax=Spiroplasma sp. TIUS-1 TaxID=216963 RepID=UPI001398054E|nr:Nif3-like dinuclear metal center hexameric protein [Spiroplasma sp. TIUS-1]QHX35963.1 Nif3-like dinuclear metal center hexameric protein [Spiroplasma sp. TIUS-1]
MNSKKINNHELIKKLESIFPISLASDWDKPGKQIQELDNEIILTDSVVVCLDVTAKVVQFAINHNSNLIVSRHPFMFNEWEIEMSNVTKKSLYEKMIEHKIQVYSIHTNYDASENRFFIREGLAQIFENFKVKTSKFNSETLEIKLDSELKKGEIIRLLKSLFKTSNPQFSSNTDLNEKINSFYFCSGSGADVLIESNLKDIMFVTGEIKWNQWIYINENNISAVALGHYMENTFVKYIANLIKENFVNINAYKFNINNMYEQLKG